MRRLPASQQASPASQQSTSGPRRCLIRLIRHRAMLRAWDILQEEQDQAIRRGRPVRMKNWDERGAGKTWDVERR